MIRGAIALGLAIKAEHYFTEYEFVVTSVLALVIISTLLFGSFMPLVAKCLLKPVDVAPNHVVQGVDQQLIDKKREEAKELNGSEDYDSPNRNKQPPV